MGNGSTVRPSLRSGDIPAVCTPGPGTHPASHLLCLPAYLFRSSLADGLRSINNPTRTRRNVLYQTVLAPLLSREPPQYKSNSMFSAGEHKLVWLVDMNVTYSFSLILSCQVPPVTPCLRGAAVVAPVRPTALELGQRSEE